MLKLFRRHEVVHFMGGLELSDSSGGFGVWTSLIGGLHV